MDIYPSNFENKIGFDKVREILQGRCLVTLGKEQVDLCCFFSSCEDIELQLDETIEPDFDGVCKFHLKP
jgi:DNA mismatch repair protein MutS2